MNEEQTMKMASAFNSQKDRAMLRAVEKIGQSLEGIHYTLARLSHKLLEETAQDCMDTIAEMVVAPPPVEVREKKNESSG